jgi:hypothetical protein
MIQLFRSFGKECEGNKNRISGVMVSIYMLASSVVDHGFEPRICQFKDFEIGICSLHAKHAACISELAL